MGEQLAGRGHDRRFQPGPSEGPVPGVLSDLPALPGNLLRDDSLFLFDLESTTPRCSEPGRGPPKGHAMLLHHIAFARIDFTMESLEGARARVGELTDFSRLLTPCRRCWSHWPVPATGHPQVLFQLHPGPTVRQALQGRAVAHDDDAGGRFVLLGQPTPTGPAAQGSGRPWSARRHPHGAGSRPPHPHGRRSGERRAYSNQTEPPPQRERPWLPAILCGATTMATWPFTSSRLVGFTPIRTDWKSSRVATAPMTCTHGIHSMHTGRARLKHGQSSGLAPLLRRSCSRPTRPPTLLKEPSCARTCASPPPQPPPPP